MHRLILALFLALTTTAAGTAHADCPGRDGAAFAGIYDFTTVVLGAKRPGAIGVNGYYRMIVQPDGCALNVGIVKVGFTGTMFPLEKLQYGNFKGTVYSVPSGWQGPRTALLVDAELQSEAGSSLSVGFTFIDGFAGSGMWRYLGSSWDSAGMWGGLTRQSITDPKGPYQAPLKLRCDGKLLKTNDTVGTAIACPDLIVANARLDRVLHLVPSGGENLGDTFTKIAAVGSAGAMAFVDYCTEYSVDHETEANGTKNSFRLLVDGTTAIEGKPDAASLRKCGVRAAPPKPQKDRWGGKVE